MSDKLKNKIMAAGALLLLAGATLFITGWFLSPYIYCVGAIMFAAAQLKCGYEGTDIVVKRLRRQQILGAMLIVLTGVLMFITRHNEWIICLSIAAVLELYTAFRMPAK